MAFCAALDGELELRAAKPCDAWRAASRRAGDRARRRRRDARRAVAPGPDAILMRNASTRTRHPRRRRRRPRVRHRVPRARRTRCASAPRCPRRAGERPPARSAMRSNVPWARRRRWRWRDAPVPVPAPFAPAKRSSGKRSAIGRAPRGRAAKPSSRWTRCAPRRRAAPARRRSKHEPRSAQRLGGVRRGDGAERRPAVRVERDQAGDQGGVRRGEGARGQAGRRVRDEEHGAAAAQIRIRATTAAISR